MQLCLFGEEPIMKVNDKRTSQKLDPSDHAPLTRAPQAVPALIAIALPPALAAVFERAPDRPAPAPQQALTEIVSLADVSAALTTHVLPLVTIVEEGPKPPQGMKPASAGSVVDEQPLERGAPFGQVLRQVSNDLRAENTSAAIKDSIHEMLVLTTALTPPVEVMTNTPLKPSPVVARKVAELLKAQGDLLTGKRQGAPQAFEEIEVIEGTRAMLSGFDFSTMDVETMAMIVMFQASDDANQDLREMLKQMKSTKDKKDAMRARMNAMKDMQAKADQQLRSEYNRRQRLAKDDPDYVPPSITFDQFKLDQKLSFNHDDEGGISGTTLGDGIEYPPQSDATENTNGGADANETGTPPTPPANDWTGIPDDVKAAALIYNLPADVAREAMAIYDALSGSGMLAAMFGGNTPSFKDFVARQAEVRVEISVAGTRISLTGQPGQTIDVPGLGPFTLPDGPGTLVIGGDTQKNINMFVAQLKDIQATYLNKDWVMQQLVGNPPSTGGQFQNVMLTAMLANFEDGEVDVSVRVKLERLRDGQKKIYDTLKNAALNLFGDQFGAELSHKENELATKWKESLKNSYADWNGSVRAGFPSDWSQIIGKSGFSYQMGNNTFVAKFPDYLKALVPLLQSTGMTPRELLGVIDTDHEDRVLGHKTIDRFKEETLRKEYEYLDRNPKSAGTIGDVKVAIDAALAKLKAWRKPQRFDVAMTVIHFDLAQAARLQHEPENETRDERASKRDSAGEGQSTGTFADIERMIQEQKDKLDSVSEVGEQQQLRLQMYMDAVTGIHATLSNLFKKLSDTAGGIVANLK
ncbi:MAG: hypothetical protein IT381_14945 [Deltaproteobacteria bacterium]|nr:hypothetical protein [Deltaproteobacteria bacterium]